MANITLNANILKDRLMKELGLSKARFTDNIRREKIPIADVTIKKNY